MPKINSSAAASKAMELFDKDGDGQLSPAEMVESPGLQAALAKVDANGDGNLDRDEIANRLQSLLSTGAAAIPVSCSFTLDGKPVGGADVTLLPEPFLSESITPARGFTNARGVADIAAEDTADVGGTRLGFYRVQISLKDSTGKETIPAKFNSQTELGIEVAPDAKGVANGRFVFDLKS